MLNLDTSANFKEIQPLNISDISVTLLVSNLESSKEDMILHSLNIAFIFTALSDLKLYVSK